MMTTLAADLLPAPPTADDLEQQLLGIESLVSRLRARQIAIVREIDARQVPHWDGTRSLKEWVAGRLDVHPTTASDIAHMAKSTPGKPEEGLAEGNMSFDRAAVTTRLANSGADADTLERSAAVAVHQVGQMTARQRRLTEWDEESAFRNRRLWLQPNLDRTLMTGTLTLAGADADLLLAALDERADQLCRASDGLGDAIDQRRADALVSLATDQQYGPPSTSGPAGPAPGVRRPKAHIFVDADFAARTDGQAGSGTRRGLAVGRHTLEEILCIGTTQVTLVDIDGLTPIPTAGDSPHPRIHDFIWKRDGGCTADGCTSTYRLEPHHIRERSQGGDHHPDNLTLLCWFHHHVVIHRRGFGIDPKSPTGKRRFLSPGPQRPHAPPDG